MEIKCHPKRFSCVRMAFIPLEAKAHCEPSRPLTGFILSGFSALKEPSFLQRTMFSSASEGIVCGESKRTGDLILLLRRGQNQGNNYCWVMN